MKKYITIITILFLVAMFSLVAYLEFGNIGNAKNGLEDSNATSTATTTPNKNIACLEEAIQCPDGSLVYRSGPNCDFEACPTVNTEEPVACTMEAKQCPDGSYVGRQGPKCEFAPCPEAVEKNCPQLAPIGPGFCPNGKIEFGGLDDNGCQLPPKCVN